MATNAAAAAKVWLLLAECKKQPRIFMAAAEKGLLTVLATTIKVLTCTVSQKFRKRLENQDFIKTSD